MHTIKQYRISLIFILMLAAGSMVSAQDSKPRPWWITLGGGTAVTDGTLTMALGAAYGKLWESSVISGRIFGVTNDNPTIRRIDPAATTYRLTDYGILYGPAWSGRHGFVSVGAGLGMVRITIENGPLSTTRSGISLPLEAQAFLHFAGSFGLGVYAFSSISGIQTFSGAIVALQLGVLTPPNRSIN